MLSDSDYSYDIEEAVRALLQEFGLSDYEDNWDELMEYSHYYNNYTEENLLDIWYKKLNSCGIVVGVTVSQDGTSSLDFDIEGRAFYDGLLYVTREDAVKEFGLQWRVKAKHCLESESEVYSQWASGDVYGFTLTITEDGEEITEDSCGGFYGSELEENGMLEHLPSEWCEIIQEGFDPGTDITA